MLNLILTILRVTTFAYGGFGVCVCVCSIWGLFKDYCIDDCSGDYLRGGTIHGSLVFQGPHASLDDIVNET